MKILITGSTFWNSGDDLVRHGAMAAVEYALERKHGKQRIQWHLYSFTHPRTNDSALREDPNLVRLDEVHDTAKAADLIVVPGLSVGQELESFFSQVAAAGCLHKLVFIGGMNENAYCFEWATRLEQAYGVFSRAKLVIGRTRAHPVEMEKSSGGYRWLPCPSVLGNMLPPRHGFLISAPILYSIQLDAPSKYSVTNHLTTIAARTCCSLVMEDNIRKHGVSDVQLVAHHKSECREPSPVPEVEVEFYPEEQMLNDVYKRCRAVVSTRLHAVLRAASWDIPAILINETDRHCAAMEAFPRIPRTMKVMNATSWVDACRDAEWWACERADLTMFRHTLLNDYVDVLKPVL